MTSFLKEKTRKIRYGIVKTIAPSLYQDRNLRPLDIFLKNNFGLNSLVGVEIGVWQGVHAKKLLETLNFNRFYLVDSYLPFTEGDIVFTTKDAENNFTITKQNVNGYPTVEFLKMPSIKAAQQVPNNLDFVYIDADHTYEGAATDIKAWYPKVREGGVVGGHDFNSDFQSVVHAVIDFSRSINAKLHFSPPDWWIIKGEKNEGLFS